MSSGVAMNRKIQRESGNLSSENLMPQNGHNMDENMTHGGAHPRVTLRQTKDTTPTKYLKGTPVQKNWYLLSIHEKRLNRLETCVKRMMQQMDELHNTSNMLEEFVKQQNGQQTERPSRRRQQPSQQQSRQQQSRQQQPPQQQSRQQQSRQQQPPQQQPPQQREKETGVESLPPGSPKKRKIQPQKVVTLEINESA